MKERITVGDKQHLRRLLSLGHEYLQPIQRISNLDSHRPDVEIVSNTQQIHQMQMWQGASSENAAGVRSIPKRSDQTKIQIK